MVALSYHEFVICQILAKKKSEDEGLGWRLLRDFEAANAASVTEQQLMEARQGSVSKGRMVMNEISAR